MESVNPCKKGRGLEHSSSQGKFEVEQNKIFFAKVGLLVNNFGSIAPRYAKNSSTMLQHTPGPNLVAESALPPLLFIHRPRLDS